MNHAMPVPGSPLRYCQDTNQPPGSLRDLLEAVIDGLITLLDAVDGDADAEPGTDDDGCWAEDRLGCGGDTLPGDASDAEPDDEDRNASEDEPLFVLPGCTAFG